MGELGAVITTSRAVLERFPLPARTDAAVPTSPTPTARPTSADRVPVIAPQGEGPIPSGPLVPPIRRRRKAEIWARLARIRLKRTWGAFSADFAANALTYLGVLLAVVVIYAFFAFGYFGEVLADGNRQWREFAFVGVITFFVGTARLLRTRSSIPQTAIAIEVIGVVLIPIMLAGTIRDWCGPDEYW